MTWNVIESYALIYLSNLCDQLILVEHLHVCTPRTPSTKYYFLFQFIFKWKFSPQLLFESMWGFAGFLPRMWNSNCRIQTWILRSSFDDVTILHCGHGFLESCFHWGHEMWNKMDGDGWIFSKQVINRLSGKNAITKNCLGTALTLHK